MPCNIIESSFIYVWLKMCSQIPDTPCIVSMYVLHITFQLLFFGIHAKRKNRHEDLISFMNEQLQKLLQEI